MYRVIEVAKLLGVSKVTVYKKMELLKKELKPHIRYRSNIAYIEDPGVTIIRQSLSLPHPDVAAASTSDSEIERVETSLEETLEAVREQLLLSMDLHCSDLLQQLESLAHMIRNRREENERKEQQLKVLQRLVKWNKSSLAFVDRIHGSVMQSGE
jgi:hypothetical protein